MRIIFFGSDDFALVNFKRLIASGFTVVAAVAPPDRPKGRGMKLVTSPIKDFAQQHDIPVLQPTDLNDDTFLASLRALQADVLVVIAYGMFLPVEVLDIPKIMALNVHGSLLPKYRGAAPINWAIIRGEEETGVTIFKLNPRMDAGEMISQQRLPIAPDDTAMTLRMKMAALSADVLDETLSAIEEGNYTLTPQDEAAVTFAPKLTREHGRVDWSLPAEDLYNLVRGLLPWPAAYTTVNGKRLKILEAQGVEIHLKDVHPRPGEVMGIDEDGILVRVGDSALCLTRVQPESGKAMDAASFARGHRLSVGDILGG